MDKNTLTHTTWECKYHIVFAPKYRRQIIYGNIKADVANILSNAVQKKRGRDYRGRMLQRSYTYAGKNTTKSKRIFFYGIFKG